MSRDLPPLNALRAFEATARLNSVSQAAEQLHVTHGAVSRQLKVLEEHLGVSLFVKDGRGLKLTDAGVRLRDVKSGKVWDQEVDGFFLAIGHIPNTKVFAGQLETDADGYILSKGGARTSVEGVFHAGDVEDRTYRQAITAAGAGCKAAIEVERFLEAEGH